MRAMAREGVKAGECGGAAIGLLERLMTKKCADAAAARKQLGLGPSARVLVFNTEGATDGVNYSKQMKLKDVDAAKCKFGYAPPLPAAAK